MQQPSGSIDPTVAASIAPPGVPQTYAGTVHLTRALIRFAKFSLEAAALVTLVLLFFVRLPQVNGHSMEPQLRAGEHVLINTLAYGLRAGGVTHAWIDVPFGQIARNDVVAFLHSDADGSAVYVKRVIGLPGETIAIDHGAVSVNGRRLDEPYISLRDSSSFPATTVARGTFFVLGDNRGESDDSRAFGSVPQSAVIGRASFIVWPLNRAGQIR